MEAFEAVTVPFKVALGSTFDFVGVFTKIEGGVGVGVGVEGERERRVYVGTCGCWGS